jgi:hypothetical protein
MYLNCNLAPKISHIREFGKKRFWEESEKGKLWYLQVISEAELKKRYHHAKKKKRGEITFTFFEVREACWR